VGSRSSRAPRISFASIDLAIGRRGESGITYIDIWDGFVDDQGRFVQDGPDFEGQTRRLRTNDGVILPT